MINDALPELFLALKIPMKKPAKLSRSTSKNRKRKSRNRQADYSQLESRNLLAGLSASSGEFPVYAETAFHQTANLLTNGDFEAGTAGDATGNFEG